MRVRKLSEGIELEDSSSVLAGEDSVVILSQSQKVVSLTLVERRDCRKRTYGQNLISLSLTSSKMLENSWLHPRQRCRWCGCRR